mgnify:CR=1 FL=1
MASRKPPATKEIPNNPENPVQVLKEATCPSSSGKTNLTYQIGADEDASIHFQITANSGNGFFSAEWIALYNIQAAIETWPDGQPITSMTFHKLFRGKSANNPGFLLAVLVAEGLLEPVPDKKRVFQACDPAAFVARVQGEEGVTPAKSKARPRAKAKASTTRKKSPALAKRKS